MYGFKTLASAVCYFLFNWQFFRCSSVALGAKGPGRRDLGWSFVLNFTIFIVCSMLPFHLIVNWMVVLILLFGEVKLIFRQPLETCLILALLGTQLGLAMNILLRSLTSVVLNVPLMAFDNSTGMPGNMKAYPVILGFLLTGGFFMVCKRWNLLRNLKLVLRDRENARFLLALLIAMQVYLCLNLLVYYIEDNSMVFKLWSMKSSIFVMVGQGLSVFFAIRLSQLSIYREENQRSRELLAIERVRERELRAAAMTDPLTSCENRSQADRRLKEALSQGADFQLVFVDLNGLKLVNDGFGHEMGDRYLLAVSKVLEQICGPNDLLFRYGGDEFLLLLFDISYFEAKNRLKQAQQCLDVEGKEQDFPFHMTVSYGTSSIRDGSEAVDLIRIADQRMYEMKRKFTTPLSVVVK